MRVGIGIRLRGLFVHVGEEGRVEAVDHVAQADDYADLDDLLVAVVRGEVAVEIVVDEDGAGRAATTVSCPLHARKIELKTGVVQNDDLSRVLTFPVKVEEGKVLLDAEVLFLQPEAGEEEQATEEEEEAVA